MLLTAIIFAPLLFAIVAMLLPREEETLVKHFGVAASVLVFVASLALLYKFDPKVGDFQQSLWIQKTWVKSLGISFFMAVDGISLWLVLLTTFITPVAIIGAGASIQDKGKYREFVAAMLVLETGMLGAFVALDMVLFFMFWEVMLVPMYLLIGVWGGKRRVYSAIKFVIYTMVGSVLMLVAIIYLYIKFHQTAGIWTFNLLEWNRMLLTPSEQMWCFGAFALAFAIKVPVVPLHTWLPDAHVEAPTPGSVILAGVLLKLGTYGFLRFAMPLFPYASTKFAPYIAALGIIGIIYGAMLAYSQTDAKKLIAYSSISHLGFVLLGMMSLTTQGIEGAIYIMLAHGITSGGLFLGFGMLYDRRHTREMGDYGGLWKSVPTFSALYLVIVLGSVGLPGLCGFVGEFLVVVGSFDHASTLGSGGPLMLPYPKLMTAAATLGVILGAIYLLVMFQKLFFGPVKHAANKGLKDITGRELAAILPLVVMTVVMGVMPGPFLKRMEPSVKNFIAQYRYKYDESKKMAKEKATKPRLLEKAILQSAPYVEPVRSPRDRLGPATPARAGRGRPGRGALNRSGARRIRPRGRPGRGAGRVRPSPRPRLPRSPRLRRPGSRRRMRPSQPLRLPRGQRREPRPNR